MRSFCKTHCFLALTLLLTGVGEAAETSWDQRLAEFSSARLRAVQKQLQEIPKELEKLPRIPIDDQGGTGGFACIHRKAVAQAGKIHAVDVMWDEESTVDLVSLVPARRYDARGLDAYYGMPEEFTVELLAIDGNPTACIAHEKNTLQNPVRKGHPFVYQVNPPIKASGVRITAKRLRADTDDTESHVHAWAELLAFNGEENLAFHAKVTAIGGSPPPAPWHWQPEFLVDGQTPLGLPEVPETHRNVGWISNGRDDANKPATLTIDLGNTDEVVGVRLIPARKPTADLPSGFGFPRKIMLSISATGETGAWTTVLEKEMGNPGHNPVLLNFETSKAKLVRVEAVKLWKDFESYPAFFALSEVEVLGKSGNLSEGKPVRSSDGMLNIIGPGGTYWSGASLTDGFGPGGRLVSTRAWLSLLDNRLSIEKTRYNLQAEAAQLVRMWRGRALVASIILGLAGVFCIIALPIRYRSHSRRELVKVRERIAGDLHDEVGSNLGSIQMFADLADGRSGPSDELKRIQRIASETVSAVRDIVWLLRPGGDHRIGAVEHLRETSSIMLETLRWEFHANEESWQIELPEEVNRHLFLYFREALHNILRHSKATHVDVRVETGDGRFLLKISDDGQGIPPERLERPATLRALRQRAESLAADLKVVSKTDEGTTLELAVPIGGKRRRKKNPSHKSQSPA